MAFNSPLSKVRSAASSQGRVNTLRTTSIQQDQDDELPLKADESDFSPTGSLISTSTDKDFEKNENGELDPIRNHPEPYKDGSARYSFNTDAPPDGEIAEPQGDVEKQSAQTPEQEPPKDANLVDWDGPDDPENPMNFPRWRKWLITASFGLMTLCITFASSIFSTATEVTAKRFDVSVEVTTLASSIMVAGFAVGPIIWGPLSELYGRKLPLFTGFFLFALFQIPVAVAQNIQTIIVCRFLMGVFGSSPLAVVGGALADMWTPIDRGIAMCVFSGATFIGPIAGPIGGGFITMSHLTWRWTAWVTCIIGFGFGIIGFIIAPETFSGVLLHRRAKKLRKSTGNQALYSHHDEVKVDFNRIINVYLLRPFAMLVLEPILLLITLYMSLIYGIIYLFFVAFPISFTEQRGWNIGVGALPFIALAVGVCCSVGLIIYFSKTRFARAIEKTGHVVPEERLVPMIIGGAAFPIGCFWFAWTSNPNITWVPQVIAGVPIGMGLMLIFLQGLNYIIDVYTIKANSAISANTFVRSLLGAGFPLFANQMYHKLGVPWATSLLGFLLLAMFPIPILFFIYGKRIRALSRYSPNK